MSVEQELARIADALERIADARTGNTPVVVPPAETKTEPKRKSTKAVKEVVASMDAEATVDAGDTWFDGGADPLPAKASEPALAVDDLMKYCTVKLSDLKSPEERKAKVQAVVTQFDKAFGVKNVRSIPADKTNEAKAVFDKIMGA